MAQKKENKTIHKPFGKRFYKLLGGSVLGLAAIYGGIIFANSIVGCNILDAFNQFSGDKVCVALGEAGTSFSTEEFAVSSANNDSAIGAGGYETNLIGKQLRFTNNNADKGVFVPVRQA